MAGQKRKEEEDAVKSDHDVPLKRTRHCVDSQQKEKEDLRQQRRFDFKLLLRNCSQVVQVAQNNVLFKCGKDMDQVHVLENRTVVVNTEGRIVAILTQEEFNIHPIYPTASYETEI